ncbi:hypothetical protein Tco_1533820 [Tanacetum coccineum]
MLLKYVLEGPLVYPTVEENGVTRLTTYEEVSDTKKLQDDCDLYATNIVLQGTELSYQERECKLYNEFDKFASIKVGTLHEYYMRFAQLMNDIHIIGMTMQQVQVNTKFLNGLQPEWSKFVTDVKLAKSMYTTNYDQLYAYLSQHERHANEYQQQLSLNPPHAYNHQPQSQSYQAPPHLSQYHALVNHLLPSGSGVNKNRGNNVAVPARVVRCYNFQGEWHMARQCTQLKRPRNSAWFKEKLMLVEAWEAGQVLDEE